MSKIKCWFVILSIASSFMLTSCKVVVPTEKTPTATGEAVTVTGETTNEMEQPVPMAVETAPATPEKPVAKPEAPVPVPEDKWVLVWEDNFDGTGIPSTKRWEFLDYLRWKNDDGPEGYWKKEDVYLDGKGHLIIRAQKIPNQNGDKDSHDYSTGGIRTMGRFEQAFGKFEIRCKLPTQPGWWAAFWLMTEGQHNIDGSGRDGTEIDIMESFGVSEDINHALHWDGYGPEHRGDGKKTSHPGIKSGFHTFALEWYENLYIFYVDGQEVWQSNNGGISQVPEYVKVTAEISSVAWTTTTNWAGNPELGVFPDYFTVDYVKVYNFRNPADRLYTNRSDVLDRETKYLNKPVIEMPYTPRPITLTGNDADWEGIGETVLNKTGELVAPGAGVIAPDDTWGTFKYTWDDTNFYIRADVIDDVPMVNPQKNGDIWNGDDIEITLSTDPGADKQRKEFAASDFQIGLSAGDRATGLTPSIWCWTLNSSPEGAKIFSVQTEKGYRIEAAIPWKTLKEFKPKAGMTLGFDFAIDDADQGGTRESQSVWFGDGGFYKEPMVWGTMKLVK